LLDLVSLAAEGTTDVVGTAGRDEVMASILTHIRKHAHDPELDVHDVAAALGWSVRYVQAVLHDAGTTCRDLIRH
jgi:AraC-like DNA-binding protein